MYCLRTGHLFYLGLLTLTDYHKSFTLSQYVKYRTGVALGASGSLVSMLKLSFGAGSMRGFWKYWNPIWSYYLGKYIYYPLNKVIPSSLALLITFILSGALHDLAVMLIKGHVSIKITVCFLFFALLVIIGDVLKVNYKIFSWSIRMLINSCYLVTCMLMTYFIFSA